MNRLLEKGESLKEGDEYFNPMEGMWLRSYRHIFDDVANGLVLYRRKIEAPEATRTGIDAVRDAYDTLDQWAKRIGMKISITFGEGAE